MKVACRLVGALAVLLGGSIHLQQWLTVFRDLDVGPLFLANVVASVVVGAALLAYDTRLVAAAGIVLSAGSLLALYLSRTTGLVGFEATGYELAEVEAIVVEGLALVALAAYLVGARAPAGAPDPAADHAV
jgi:hypothetical protein